MLEWQEMKNKFDAEQKRAGKVLGIPKDIQIIPSGYTKPAKRKILNDELLTNIINAWNRNKYDYFQDIDDIDEYIDDLLFEELNSVIPEYNNNSESSKNWRIEYNKLIQYLKSDIPKKNEEVPEDIICPITQTIMDNPYRFKDIDCQEAFEYDAIVMWIKKSGHHPLTREQVEIDQLIPAKNIVKKIYNYRANLN